MVLAVQAETKQQRLVAEQIDGNGSAFQRLYRLSWQHAATTDKLALSDLPTHHTIDSNRNATANNTITLFYFNDLHGKVVIPDARRGDTAVFAQMMHIVGTAREQNKHPVLFVSAGDDHTGEVYDELLGTSVESFQLSLPYHTYSYAGVDAAVIGNHELDRGVVILKKKIEENARFPLLSANITHSDVLAYPLISPALIGDVAGARIGLIGLTSYQDSKKQHEDDPGFTLIPPLVALQQVASQLAPHVDVILLLSHLGYQQDGVIGDIEMANWLSELMVPAIVVGAHSHTLLHETGFDPQSMVAGVPILQAGSWGSHLGEFTFSLQRSSNQQSSLVILESILHPIMPNVKEGKLVDEAFQQRVIDPVLAQFNDLLSEHIGMVANSIELSTLNTLAMRYIGESAMANLLTDAVFSRQRFFSDQQVDAVAFNASGIIGGFTPGEPLLFKDVFRVMPYADLIQIVEVSPAQLQQILNSNAKRIVRCEEIEHYDLHEFINRGFLHFSASLRYTIVTEAAVMTSSATNITVHGRPLESYPQDHIFRLAMGDYITKGTQGWDGKSIGAGLPEQLEGFDLTQLATRPTGFVLRNEMVQALRTMDPISNAIDGRLQHNECQPRSRL